MKYYLIREDKTAYFSNNTEFVRWMRSNNKSYFETNKEFMEAYSCQQYIENETIIRYENESNFVKDLISSSLLTKEESSSEWEHFKERIKMFFMKIFSNLMVNEV